MSISFGRANHIARAAIAKGWIVPEMGCSVDNQKALTDVVTPLGAVRQTELAPAPEPALPLKRRNRLSA